MPIEPNDKDLVGRIFNAIYMSAALYMFFCLMAYAVMFVSAMVLVAAAAYKLFGVPAL